MAVHMVEIVTDPDSVSFSTVESEVQNWLDNHEEVLKVDRNNLNHAPANPEMNEVERFGGSWRFSLAEDKQVLRDEIEQVLSEYFSWWRLKYHICDHDESARGDCGWEYVNSGGNVPEAL